MCIRDSPLLGCTNQDACNYNPSATSDDGSCFFSDEYYDCDGNCVVDIDCAGVCGGESTLDSCGVCDGNNDTCLDCAGVPNGDATLDDCGICDGDGSSCTTSIELGNITDTSIDILMTNPLPLAGFQLSISGIDISAAGGGAAQDNGFSVSASGTTVLGFSLSGASISPGSGVLTTLSYESTAPEACFIEVILSDPSGQAMIYSAGPCVDVPFPILGCTDSLACNYSVDATEDDGSCWYPNEGCECFNGQGAIIDEFGICNGYGPEENFD